MSRYDVQYIDPRSGFLENAWYVAAQSAQVVDRYATELAEVVAAVAAGRMARRQNDEAYGIY